MIDDADLERAIREACFDVTPKEGALPPRVAIYRRLVRNTLAGVAEKLLPRTRAALGDAFEADFSRFLAERGPSTHYLRDVPRELVEWASAGWAPWVAELARHELATFAVGAAPHVPEAPAAEVALDRPLLLSSLARLERFAHAVHEDASPPPARDVALLYYRDAEHEVRTLELSPLAAAILARAELPLRDAIAAACEETRIPMNDETLASIARLFADLGERGVLLGAR